METPEPGQADGEEQMVELRPRTRSNPEGAEDRRSSTGSLNNSLASPPQPAVGSRVEGEGEAASSDSPPTSASAAAAPVTATGNSTASLPAMASTVKERPKPPQAAIGTQIPPSAELHLRAPRVNSPEKVIICLDLSEEMSLQKLESFNGSKMNTLNVSKMLQSPYFFFDVVYLHNGTEEQTEDTSWKDVYASFSELDSKGMCYCFEVSLCGPALELHNCMAKLLCHPLQRPFQSHASYSLLEEDDAPENEATV
ncbi:BRISC and BRCA1-A complex member 1-like [Sinocyclocheilus grahami]|uniref:BRISC and BRCA1-A complex member 1-like n=1 Tax=Sinocyclocheilus grahami TaxID=75366 RepID=UPI0007AD47A9|nr:PREDICTED: BRISC and BRCA1-A complex member 1-like [Sinocyclocheilus grahami]